MKRRRAVDRVRAGNFWVEITRVEITRVGITRVGINHGEDSVFVTSGKRATMPAADMQWRARKIAMQASKLADQARPLTKSAALTARRRAGTAANWARPRVGRVRAWMAVKAARGSVSVQETVAPRVAAMLAATARKLDPPK